MAALRSVMVATDFSEVSERAGVHAAQLAQKLGAELLLVHAYTLPAYVVPIEGSVLATPEYAASLSARLQDQLDAQAQRLREHSVRVATKLVLGVPYLEVPRLAKEMGADLLVVGTHGRTGLTHALLGSVAERIVRISEVPVLSVR